VPVHPPPFQPAKVEPLSGVAVKVTAVPRLNCALQFDPQLIPVGELVTVPLPVHDLLIERLGFVGILAKKHVLLVMARE
jgi:hypothetical protein